jgi:hypothetical protein
MIQTQRKEIGGVSVAVTPFPFTTGYPLALRWAKIITPVVGPLIKGVMAEVQSKGMSIEALMGAVEANPLAAIAILDLDRLADALEKLAASIDPRDFADLSVQTLASAAVTMTVEGRLFFLRRHHPGWQVGRTRDRDPDAVPLKLTPDVAMAWPLYRLVLERYVTLDAIHTLTLDDVEIMNSAADAWAEAGRAPRKSRGAL